MVLWGQNDSLTLTAVIDQVIANYPSIIKAQKNIEAADANIGLAKTAYYPDVNITGQYAHIGPVSEIDLSMLNLGKMQMNPADNYGISLNVNQLIYDFGRAAKNLELQKGSKTINELTLENIKQQLTLAVSGTFYNIAFLQQAVKIKDEEIATLKQHLDIVNRKKESGSATDYEVLSTQVRIATIENAKTDLQTSLAAQLSMLNSFLGNPQDLSLHLRPDFIQSQAIASFDELCRTAYDKRYDLKIAEEKKNLSESRLALVGTQNLPSLNFFAGGGWKNGYIPELNKFTPNYQVGVGLKVPLFDQGKTKYGKLVASREVDADMQEIELTGRNIANELMEAKTVTEAALQKVARSELQLQQAQQAYRLAEISYKSGSITNLDLLDTFTALSDTQLSLYKARIDYTVNFLKLKIALGEKIYE
jgi:outer membrane protein TolC